MRELLGEMLLQLKDPAQALKEFETSFKAAPNRFRGYYGAAKAAEQLGDQKKSRLYYEKLVELCRQADSERPEVARSQEVFGDEVKEILERSRTGQSSSGAGDEA